MSPRFRTIGGWLYRRAENLLAAMLTLMFAAFILQIVFRYLLNLPIGWTNEISVVLWIWLVLFGAAFVVREEEEIRFDLLYGAAGPRMRRIMFLVSAVALVVLYAMSLPAVFDYVTFMKVEKTAYLKIRFDWLYSIYIVFVVAIIVRYLWLGVLSAARPGAGRVRPHQGRVRRMNLASPFSVSIVAITVLAFLGLPIGHAMIAGSILYLYLAGLDMGTAAEQFLNGMYSNYIILAVPLFILAAELMNIGSMTERLLRFCDAVVGRFRGGLAYVNVVQSIIFAGMSGSAIADAAGTGKMMQMMMTKDGKYTPSYAAALTAVTAVIGPIIPPSIPMVIYALVSDASIGYLFLGGVLPGLLMAFAQMGIVAWQARTRNFPVEAPTPLRELPGITWRAFPSLMMPVVLLGGIYSGVDHADRGGRRGRGLCAGHLRRALPKRRLCRFLPIHAGQRAHHGVDRHADRRRAGVQLCGDRREHSRLAARPADQLGPLADRLPDPRQHPFAAARMRAGGNDDPADHRPRADPDGAGAGNRHGAFRRDGGRQHHARPGHAALWPAAVHHDAHRRSPASRHRSRCPAVPVGDDRVARSSSPSSRRSCCGCRGCSGIRADRGDMALPKPIFILNGPNLNRLGKREPEIYGTTTLAEIEAMCRAAAGDWPVRFHQSNFEGEIVELIHEAIDDGAGIIINPAGLSFTSIAILDALKMFSGPIIEFHISNIHRREAIYHHSLVSKAATAVLAGLGARGYPIAVTAMKGMLESR